MTMGEAKWWRLEDPSEEAGKSEMVQRILTEIERREDGEIALKARAGWARQEAQWGTLQTQWGILRFAVEEHTERDAWLRSEAIRWKIPRNLLLRVVQHAHLRVREGIWEVCFSWGRLSRKVRDRLRREHVQRTEIEAKRAAGRAKRERAREERRTLRERERERREAERERRTRILRAELRTLGRNGVLERKRDISQRLARETVPVAVRQYGAIDGRADTLRRRRERLEGQRRLIALRQKGREREDCEEV